MIYPLVDSSVLRCFIRENEAIRPIIRQTQWQRFVQDSPCWWPAYTFKAVGNHYIPLCRISRCDPTHHVTLNCWFGLNREPTNKLFPHFVSLPEVIHPEDEGVDDTEECDHVRDIICGLQLVHDHTEPILLCLHTLKGNQSQYEQSPQCHWGRQQDL